MKGHMEVKKHAIRQTQDGWVVSFVIQPHDITPEFAAAPLGTRFMVGYAEVGDDEKPIEPGDGPAPDPAKSERAKAAYRDKAPMQQAATRAALLCRDPLFQRRVNALNEETAADILRRYIGVSSRGEIATDHGAYERFLEFETTYQIATGKRAEAR